MQSFQMIDFCVFYTTMSPASSTSELMSWNASFEPTYHGTDNISASHLSNFTHPVQSARWELSHCAKNWYGLVDLSTTSWFHAVQTLTQSCFSLSIFLQVYKENISEPEPCNASVLLSWKCLLTTVTSFDFQTCLSPSTSSKKMPTLYIFLLSIAGVAILSLLGYTLVFYRSSSDCMQIILLNSTDILVDLFLNYNYFY